MHYGRLGNLLKILVVLLPRCNPAAGIPIAWFGICQTGFDCSRINKVRGATIEMLKKKRTGISTQREHAKPRPLNVVNVSDALRRSVAR